MVSTGFHSALHKKAQSNSTQIMHNFLSTLIYMCLLSFHKAEIYMAISLGFHNSEELGVYLSSRPSPSNQGCEVLREVHSKVIIPTFYFLSNIQLTTPILLSQWWLFLMCAMNLPTDSRIQCSHILLYSHYCCSENIKHISIFYTFHVLLHI